MLTTILVIILILILIGAFPTPLGGPYYSGQWGGGLGIILLIIIVLVLTGKI